MSLGRRILIDTLAILSVIWLILPLSCGAADNQTKNVEKEEENFEDLSPGAIVAIAFGVIAGVIIIGCVFVGCFRCHSSRMNRRREKMIIPCTDTDTHFQPSDFNRHSAFYDARSLGSSHSISNATNYNIAHFADQPTTFATHASAGMPPRVSSSKVSGPVTTLLDRVSNLRRSSNQPARGPQQQQQNLQSADLSNSPSIYPSLVGFVHQNPQVEEEAAPPTAMSIAPAFECRQMAAPPGPAYVNQEASGEAAAAASVRQIQSVKNLSDVTATAAAAPPSAPAAVSVLRDLSIDTETGGAASTPRFSNASNSSETATARLSSAAAGSGRRHLSVTVREMTRRLFAAVLRQSVDEEGGEEGEVDDVDGPNSSSAGGGGGPDSSRRVFKTRAGGGGGGMRRAGMRPSGGGGGHKTSNAFGSTSSLTSSRGGGGGGGGGPLSVSGISERLARRKNKHGRNRQCSNEGHYNVNGIGDAAELDEFDAPLDNDHFLHSLESAVFSGIYEHYLPTPTHTLEMHSRGDTTDRAVRTAGGPASAPRSASAAGASAFMLQAGDLGSPDVYWLERAAAAGDGYAAAAAAAAAASSSAAAPPNSSSQRKQPRVPPRRALLPPGSPVIGFAFQQPGGAGDTAAPRAISDAGVERAADMGSVSTIATVLAPGAAAAAQEEPITSDIDSSSPSLIYQGEPTPTHVPISAATAPFPPSEPLRPQPATPVCDLRSNRQQPAPAPPPPPTSAAVKAVAKQEVDSPPADSGLAGCSHSALGDSEAGQPTAEIAAAYDATEAYDFRFEFDEEEGAGSADPTLRLEAFDSVDDSDLGAGGSSIDSASEMLPSKPLASVATNRKRTLMHLRSPSMPGCVLSPLLPSYPPGPTTKPGEVLQAPASRRSRSVTQLIPPPASAPPQRPPALAPQPPLRDRQWKSRVVESWLSEESWRNLPSSTAAAAALEPSTEVVR